MLPSFLEVLPGIVRPGLALNTVAKRMKEMPSELPKLQYSTSSSGATWRLGVAILLCLDLQCAIMAHVLLLSPSDVLQHLLCHTHLVCMVTCFLLLLLKSGRVLRIGKPVRASHSPLIRLCTLLLASNKGKAAASLTVSSTSGA